MTGQALYEMWCSKLATQAARHQYQGPTPKAWQFLDYGSRTAWTDLAGSLALRENEETK